MLHVFKGEAPVQKLSTMLFVTLALLVTVCRAGGAAEERSAEYAGALHNPTLLLHMYNSYTARFNPAFGAQETRFRVRLFREEVKRIVAGNRLHGHMWLSGINKFSAMTSQEKRQYLGLNMTYMPEVAVPGYTAVVETEEAQLSAVKTKDWRKQGKVTGVKDQGTCGSCWAFAAVAVVESVYSIMTGRRKQFAEQECVDCAYEGDVVDTCDKGGFYTRAWWYAKVKGRLATQAKAPYKGRDGYCNYQNTHNGLISAKIADPYQGLKNERELIRALNSRPVAVGYEVTDEFSKYDSGIIKDETCVGTINHAVTAVGYTQNAMIVKNSWGGTWGESGYFRTARFHHGCQIYKNGYYTTLSYTSRPDTDPEYVPTEDEDCKGTNADGCKCGTVRCGDGVCRHTHMC